MFRKIVYIIWLNEGQCIRNSRNKANNLIQSSRNQGELYINPPWIAPKKQHQTEPPLQGTQRRPGFRTAGNQ